VRIGGEEPIRDGKMASMACHTYLKKDRVKGNGQTYQARKEEESEAVPVEKESEA